MSLTLQPLEGPTLKPLTFDSENQKVILGRHDECDVVLQSEFVSRRHALLECNSSHWSITDLDSKDGVFIDSIRIEQQVPVRFYEGELITIGPWEFRVQGTIGRYSTTLAEKELSDTLPTNSELLQELHDSASTKRERAWRSFVERYEPVIRGVARKYSLHEEDVEDVLQDVLHGLFRLGSLEYDEHKGRFRAYLKTATKNAVIRKWEKKPKEVPLTSEEQEGDFELYWEARWRKQLLVLALQAVQTVVTPEQYEAFELFGRRGVSAQQVAQRLGISAEVVRQHKKRVMELVRSEIQRQDDAQ